MASMIEQIRAGKITDKQAEINKMIVDCCEFESQLNNWERGFIDSISVYVANGNFLSSKQEATLRKIHDNVQDYIADNNMGDC